MCPGISRSPQKHLQYNKWHQLEIDAVKERVLFDTIQVLEQLVRLPLDWQSISTFYKDPILGLKATNRDYTTVIAKTKRNCEDPAMLQLVLDVLLDSSK